MVVVDSCVLILLGRIGKLSLLKYFNEVLITPEIYKEVTEDNKVGSGEIEKACKDWIKIIKSKNDSRKLEGLEKADLSVLMLAKKKDDILLTNDRALIQVAKSKELEYYWLTTFLLKLVKEKEIGKKEAKDILFDLVKNGMRLKIEVYTAILKKIGD